MNVVDKDDCRIDKEWQHRRGRVGGLSHSNMETARVATFVFIDANSRVTFRIGTPYTDGSTHDDAFCCGSCRPCSGL